MNILKTKIEYRCPGGVAVMLLIFLSMGTGCASAHKTTSKHSTVTYPNRGNFDQGRSRTTTTVITSDRQGVKSDETRETITTTSEAKAENPGLLGSVFHAMGYVVALPFVLIGGLVRFIFGG